MHAIAVHCCIQLLALHRVLHDANQPHSRIATPTMLLTSQKTSPGQRIRYCAGHQLLLGPSSASWHPAAYDVTRHRDAGPCTRLQLWHRHRSFVPFIKYSPPAHCHDSTASEEVQREPKYIRTYMSGRAADAVGIAPDDLYAPGTADLRGA